MTVSPVPSPEDKPSQTLEESMVQAIKPAAALAALAALPPTLTAAMIRSAMAMVMKAGYQPTRPYTLSQHTHNRCNDLLGQPHNTPLTNRDVEAAAKIEFAALSSEEQSQWVRLVWGGKQ